MVKKGQKKEYKIQQKDTKTDFLTEVNEANEGKILANRAAKSLSLRPSFPSLSSVKTFASASTLVSFVFFC
jgi:hypothetical protein